MATTIERADNGWVIQWEDYDGDRPSVSPRYVTEVHAGDEPPMDRIGEILRRVAQ